MKPSSSWVLGAALVQLASAAVHFPFAKQKTTASSRNATAGSHRRSLTSGLSFQDATYVVNVTVGTPGQSMSLQISPLASDTWVIDARSNYCTDEYYDYTYTDDGDLDTNITIKEYCVWGTFSPGNSSSFALLTPDDKYSYDYYFSGTTDGGDYVSGSYMSDVLTIGDATVTNLTMGLVNDTYSYYTEGATYMGVLGIGYNDSTYDNLPNHLLDQGLINSTAYSMWVDDEAASSGSLLFGAIDTSKFDGKLTRLTADYSYYMPSIRVASINGSSSTSGGPVSITATDDYDDYYSSEGFSDFLFEAVYSPSETLSTVPSDVANQIWSLANATYDEYYESAVIDCSAASDNTTVFTFQLGAQDSLAPILSVYMSDLVLPISEVNLSTVNYYYYESSSSDNSTDISNLCLFGIQNSTYEGYYYSLGNSLLRRTYSVFDLANYEVAVAPVKFGATATSTIVPFTSVGATVPSASAVCLSSYCTTNLASTSSTGSDDDESIAGLPGVLSLGAILGLSFGIAAFFLIAGFIAFFFWRRHVKKAAAAAAAAGGAKSASSDEQGVAANAPVLAAREASEPTAVPEMSGASSVPETSEAGPAAASNINKGKAPERNPLPLPPRPLQESEGTGAGETAEDTVSSVSGHATEQHGESSRAAEASTASAGDHTGEHVANP